MEDATEKSEMGCTGLNWALAVCLVLISTVQDHISHLQSSLHSMPVWEGNCTSPFSKQGGETKGAAHDFYVPPQSQAGGLQVNGIETLSPKLTGLSAIFTSSDKLLCNQTCIAEISARLMASQRISFYQRLFFRGFLLLVSVWGLILAHFITRYQCTLRGMIILHTSTEANFSGDVGAN